MGIMQLRVDVSPRMSTEVFRRLHAIAEVSQLRVRSGAVQDDSQDVIKWCISEEALENCLELLSEYSDVRIQEIRPVGVQDSSMLTRRERNTLMWANQLAQAQNSSFFSLTYGVFIVVAVILAAIAVLTDSAILVVGAMVVGPDFAPVAALCTGVAFKERSLIVRSLCTLWGGYLLATVVVTLLACITLYLGLFTPLDVLGARPQTGFIWRPNIWSFLVAVLAGAVGVWALDTHQSSALIGVFISVTTIPAVGNLALGIAIGSSEEVVGSAAQLVINVLGMCVAGIVMLLIQRALWRANVQSLKDSGALSS
ncbi:DUF389 domain-containing protein [Rothia sp. P6271]|uniref:DUF389 domain-containing protein n=1 Tax=Rothia sp. P6271 TaxID=3402659 RepID=UPI003ACBFA3F